MKIYLYAKINCAFIGLGNEHNGSFQIPGNEPEADDLMESDT